jgi:hypothetical protein
MDGGVVVEAGSIADVLAILLSQRCEGGNLDDDTRIDLDCRIIVSGTAMLFVLRNGKSGVLYIRLNLLRIDVDQGDLAGAFAHEPRKSDSGALSLRAIFWCLVLCSAPCGTRQAFGIVGEQPAPVSYSTISVGEIRFQI